MISIDPIGVIHSPYKEKFAVPRQSGLNQAESTLEIFLEHSELLRLRGLEEFSHLWVIFLFHLVEDKKAEEQVLVRPPRLGGNLKKGIYATRTPHRPNRIGLSVVKIKSIEGNKIQVIGGDFVHGTPILDLKPYIAEEAISSARFGWTDEVNEITELQILFRPHLTISLSEQKELQELLKLDPRPAHHKNSDPSTLYKVFIKDYNLSFTISEDNNLWVEDISKVNTL